MSQRTDASFDSSWMLNDTDDGDISWAEDDTDSEPEDVKRNSKSSPRPPLQLTPQKRPHPAATTPPEPQLVMPSIEEVSSKPRQRMTGRRQSANTTPSRNTRSNLVIPRNTPGQSRQHRTVVENNSDRESDFASRALDIVGSILRSVFDILSDTLTLLKKPISWILAGYAVLIFFQFTQNLVTSSFYNALSPICRIPGTGFLDLPMCRPYGEHNPRLPSGAEVPDPEFDALMKVQGQFESIMDDTSMGLSLPVDMKRSEASIRDLRQVVRYSEIPNKHELLHEFDGFVATASIASFDLQKFFSHVGRGVDIILSTARWTQRMLDDFSHEQDERGIIPAFISDTLLAPFKPMKFTESRLLNQYIEHSHVVSGEIERLIEEAQALLLTLQNLEDRLEVIHSISYRGGLKVKDDKDAILQELWSWIGGNQAKKRKVNDQIQLLAQVGQYRKTAFNHVASTIIRLQSMEAELEELRNRVGSASALNEAGVKHVPLAVHIDNIQLGVERLEIGRQRARELEQKHVRGIIDGAEANAQKDIKYIDS